MARKSSVTIKLCIGIDESAQFRIVIAGLEIVEPGLSILGQTTMPVFGVNYSHEIDDSV